MHDLEKEIETPIKRWITLYGFRFFENACVYLAHLKRVKSFFKLKHHEIDDVQW